MRGIETGQPILSPAEIEQTAAFIASVQRDDGEIPWFPGGHTDPWDHVEAAMALDVAERHEAAATAYRWLRCTQNTDGSWYAAYRDGAVGNAMRETNFSAYVATGVWHHYLATGDDAFLEEMWPTVAAAVEFVIGLQAPGGEIRWAQDAEGRTAAEALLAGCSSMYQSLRCALAVAERRGEPQPDWELAAGMLGHAVVSHPERFAPKDRFSLDWYYPILGGALRGRAALRRIAERWEQFVVPGLGIRCVDDRPWVTGAETCELALALWALGDAGRAAETVASMQHLRHADGSYWTGYVFADEAIWPEERTTWTAGAVLLAVAELTGDRATTIVFGGRDLPLGLASDRVECSSGLCADATQYPQRSGGRHLRHLGELAAVQRLPVDPVRRPPAVGGVGEHVVDGQQSARGHAAPSRRGRSAPRRWYGRRR